MGSLRAIALFCLLASFLLVEAVDQSLTYRCEATTGGEGTFKGTILENGALTLLAAGTEAIDDSGVVCTTDPVIITLTAGSSGEWTFDVASTDIAKCGLTIIGTVFTVVFQTKSLTNGYLAKDKRYTLACDFTKTDGELTADAVGIFSALDAESPTSSLPALSMKIMKYPNGGAIGTALGTGDNVGLTDKLEIVITLDTTINGFNDFIVKECVFTGSVPDPVPADQTLTLIAVSDNCPTDDARSLGFVTKTPGFTYAVKDTTDFVAKSDKFDAFSFFLLKDETLTLKCTVKYCSDPGGAIDQCVATPACTSKRRRRSSGDTGNDNNTTQFSTSFGVGQPTHLTIESSGAGRNAACEPSSSMGYLIGLIVLAALLIFTIAVTIFMFTRMNRPQDYPKA